MKEEGKGFAEELLQSQPKSCISYFLLSILWNRKFLSKPLSFSPMPAKSGGKMPFFILKDILWLPLPLFPVFTNPQLTVKVQSHAPSDHTPVSGSKQPQNAAALAAFLQVGTFYFAMGNARSAPAWLMAGSIRSHTLLLCAVQLCPQATARACVQHYSTAEMSACTFRTRMGCCVYKIWSPEHPRAENSIQ